ncbi:hypothetical protein NOR_03909 [Metarhizium rileyi]|uniref:Uncharacterized protein n=1 Tax=Metarhizium rileyi (strain RCEF 4871) TaxID=1649241 RepID=A0A167EN12_METRR|nr:hypothetical protein NOR_03909 [Metarhizium rileyi RCEF 4871]
MSVPAGSQGEAKVEAEIEVQQEEGRMREWVNDGGAASFGDQHKAAGRHKTRQLSGPETEGKADI